MRTEIRFETASLLICALATIFFVVVIRASGLGFSLAGSSAILIPIGILLGLSAFYRCVRPDERIASAAFALGVLLWATVIIGAIALAAHSWRLPFFDSQLARFDASIGVNVSRLTELIAACPLMPQFLDHVYAASIPGVVLLACCLAIAGQSYRLKEFTLLFVMTITICGLIGINIPAEGSFAFLHMPEETLMRLPPKAGIYYMDLLHAFRSGRDKTVDFSNLVGVVTFPSFHMCMALLFSYAVRGMRIIFPPMAAFSGLTALSLFPIGGHYAIDALGGAIVFVCSVAIVEWLRRAGCVEARCFRFPLSQPRSHATGEVATK
jgi:hypothetical protein